MQLVQPSLFSSSYSSLPEQHRPSTKLAFSQGGELDYFRGRVFGGINQVPNYDLEILMKCAWQYPDQKNTSVRVDGTDILEYLVQGFDIQTTKEGSTFMCTKNDQIQYHFGVSVLESIRDHWGDLPEDFIAWVNQRRLYAAADIFWGDDGEIYMPCLDSLSGHPIICGHSPHSLVFDQKDWFLRG